MTFKQLQDAVILGRFKEADRPSVMVWINTRASRVWTAARWAFSVSDLTAIATAAGSATVPVPAAVRTVEHVYDELGEELVKLTFPDWKFRFRPDVAAGRTGHPTHFAVRNRTVYFGPIPSAVFPFLCDGQLVFGHDDGNGNFLAGDMAADTDVPYWPANHHELLVPAARSLGMRLRSDPTYPPVEDEFDSLFAAMVDELAEDHAISSYGGIDPL